MTELNNDLNAVIANAVNARIEAQVTEALCGDEVIGRFVTSALSQMVEVPAPGNSYQKVKITYIKHVLDKAIQAATRDAVARVLSEETPAIEAAVRKELKANIAALAEQIVGSVTKSAESPYGITVEMKYPGR